MKRYIKESLLPKHLTIEVELELFNNETENVAASTYKGFQVPDGPLISGLPQAIADSQALADYSAFVESVQDLLTDYYDLTIYYKNESSDHSFYFGILAKNDQGLLLFDFDFHLRISNHPAHKSKQSQSHKQEQKVALLGLTNGKKVKPIVKHILVNKEEFDNYTQAFEHVDRIIEETIEILERRSK